MTTARLFIRATELPEAIRAEVSRCAKAQSEGTAIWTHHRVEPRAGLSSDQQAARSWHTEDFKVLELDGVHFYPSGYRGLPGVMIGFGSLFSFVGVAGLAQWLAHGSQGTAGGVVTAVCFGFGFLLLSAGIRLRRKRARAPLLNGLYLLPESLLSLELDGACHLLPRTSIAGFIKRQRGGSRSRTQTNVVFIDEQGKEEQLGVFAFDPVLIERLDRWRRQGLVSTAPRGR